MPWLIALLLLLTHCQSAPKKEAPKPEVNQVNQVDRKQIKTTIDSHRRYLSQCYGKALMGKGSAKLKGTVMVRFKIGPDGKASDPSMVKEKSSLQDGVLNDCLFAGITSWDFPVHPEGEELEILYPFKFQDTPPAGMQNKMDLFEKLRSR